MQVIEAQCASILVPHDHLHINQLRTFLLVAGAGTSSSTMARKAADIMGAGYVPISDGWQRHHVTVTAGRAHLR